MKQANRISPMLLVLLFAVASATLAIERPAVEPGGALTRAEVSPAYEALPASTNEISTDDQDPHRTEVELITLRRTGFEPAELTRPEGKFLFGVNNATDIADLTFQLVGEGGSVVVEKRMRQGRPWRKVIEPPAGRYLLQVVDHPEWRCLITITPR